MGFINKLIKKGIFGLLVVFSFFVFCNGIKVSAETCSITLNDKDEYLVVNAGLKWKDSGVTAICDSVMKTNVSVQINGGTPIETENSGRDIVNAYVVNAGFYKIKYYLTDNVDVFVERQIRVLPNNLNNVKNLWIGQGNDISTENTDAFNKMIDYTFYKNEEAQKGYLTVGNFGNVGYLVAFNSRGDYMWSEKFGGTIDKTELVITDIVKSTNNDKIYYISGSYVDDSNNSVGFAKKIQINDDGSAINNTGDDFISFAEMSMVESVVTTGDYLFASGYKINLDETKTGVIGRFLLSSTGTFEYYKNKVNSQYNAMTLIVEGTNYKVIAVGGTSVTGYDGAVGGVVAVCDATGATFDDETCVNKNPYYYLNRSGATSTITMFRDIVSYETEEGKINYVVVGESRIDGVVGSVATSGAGLEDMLTVLLDESFGVLDVRLSGTVAQDTINSIRVVSEMSFVAVGNWASSGYYNFIDVSENKFKVNEQILSGTGTEIKDVFVNLSADEESQYVFVGTTQAVVMEGIVVGNKGKEDAFIATLDNTAFSNYDDIRIVQNTAICDGESDTTCNASEMYEIYWLMYGTKKISFAVDSGEISTQNVTIAPYEAYHEFVNTQNVKIMISRKIYVEANVIAPDISFPYIGVETWFLYSRPEQITLDINGGTRAPMWDEYYYPVDNHLEKDEDETYYKFASGQFDVDESETTTTSLNYIKLPSEPQSLNVAFQTPNNIGEFALIQEFSRIALVKSNYYNSGSRSVVFDGERISLRRQSYYFVYYIDLKINDEPGCGTYNGELYGDCTDFFGYAFASLSSIKKIANLVVKTYDNFIVERTDRYNPDNTNITLPVTEKFKQELMTLSFVKDKTIPLIKDMSLEVKYYELNGSSSTGYGEYLETYTSINTISYSDTKRSVKFSGDIDSDFVNEGKYTVRYCYNYGDRNCGKEASFIVDRTAPVINYNLVSGGVGQFVVSSAPNKPNMIKTSIKVTSITDIDPYAYIVVENTKYLLKCNEISELCESNIKEFVKQAFDYEKTDPDKVFEMHVYDRAGNEMNVYFKVGTANPTLSVDQKVNEDGTDAGAFTLNIDFYDKNKIAEMAVFFIPKNKDCVGANCTNINHEGRVYYTVDGQDIYLGDQILQYINAIVYNDTQELLEKIEEEKAKEENSEENEEESESPSNEINDEEMMPEPEKKTYSLTFRVSTISGDSIESSVAIPTMILDEEQGNYVKGRYVEVEGGEVHFPISAGLYSFEITDKFNNFSEDYGGIGLDKAELYVYVEDDENYTEIKATGTEAPKYEYINGESTQTGTIENGLLPVKSDKVEDDTIDGDVTEDDTTGDGSTEGGEEELQSLTSQGVAPVMGFEASEPLTYKYLEQLPTNLHSGFNKEMYYTNQFVYVKFAATTMGGVKISRANSLNNVGNYVGFVGENEESEVVVENLSCLFTFYGSSVDSTSLDTSCIGNYLFTEKEGVENIEIETSAVKEILAAQGIYFVGKEIVSKSQSGSDGEGNVEVTTTYYYLAFTKDGTYSINSEIVPVFGDVEIDVVTIPVEYSFTIDSVEPDIGFEVVCLAGEGKCKGDKLSYTEKSDFVYTDSSSPKVNLGSYDMKLLLNTDLIKYIDALGNEGSSINRLLVVSIDGVLYNAYDYSRKNDDLDEGNYLLFTESGTYEITFYDAGQNSITYRFRIDKTPPTVVEIRDLNGKNFDTYQKYVDVGVTITENSFVDGAGNALTIDVWTSAEASKFTIGIVSDGNGGCEIGAGSGYITNGECSISESNSITVNFTLEINKGENPISDIQTMTINVTDYFGNSSSKSQSFLFDNLSPYIYFVDDFTPSTNFGPNVSNQERELWITTVADSSLGNFSCNGSETLISGIIVCKDTPENEGKSNNVVINAYEAYRVSYNNFIRNQSGTHSPIANGTYLDVSNVVYKQKFVSTTLDDAKARFDNEKIYTKGKYIQQNINELIDPNKTYSYSLSGSMQDVSISDMYVNSSSYSSYTSLASCGDDKKCKLYRMYIEYGYFTSDEYYLYDRNTYSEVTNINNIVDGYTYYYSNAFVVDEGLYLPAITQEDTCVVASGTNGKCVLIGENRIKIKDSTHKYYNLISKTSEEPSKKVVSVELVGSTTKYPAMLDNSIWRVAVDNSGKEVKFGFGIPSNNGRPIIFNSIDGAGNKGNNQLETVIAIEDREAPTVKDIIAVTYKLDESNSVITKDHYTKETVYYKLSTDASCKENENYFVSTDGVTFNEVNCDSSWDQDVQHYIEVVTYVNVNESQVGQTKDTNKEYYLKTTTDLGGNNLTKEDFIITFSEPLYRVECSYYVHDSDNNTYFEEECSFNNTEYDYREEKMSFNLVYGDNPEKTYPENYFVNYRVVAYDFSGNSVVVTNLFTDREKPIIMLNDNISKEEYVQVDYINESAASKYDSSYKATGFRSETSVIDKVNNRINEIGVNSKIENQMTYNVVYKKFNFNLTYNNYIKTIESGKVVFKSVENAKVKGNETYYILIENTGNFILKGNSGFDLNGETCDVGDYCYIEDDRNYYPVLLTNDAYWDVVDSEIMKDYIGVYKIEYQTTDKSGNISDIIMKTVYIIDGIAPVMKLDGVSSNSKYGWHNNVSISFENEKEAMFYVYGCNSGSLTCTLPTEIFTPKNSSLDLTIQEVSSTVGKTFNGAGMYKLYFHDSGVYESINSCSTNSNCGSEETKVMSLVYNYVEYQFIIDQTPPAFSITAKLDDKTNNMYYEAVLSGDDSLYCIKGGRMDTNLSFGGTGVKLCQDLFQGVTTTKENGDNVIVTMTDNFDNVLYERTFEKLPATAQKYFYQTYYYKEGNQFIEYKIGETYKEDNIYKISSLKLVFRDDGTYLLRAQDRAGNIAGRQINNSPHDESQSMFIIDNTAPTYNASQNLPTGNNYWFSVPSVVINERNISNVTQISNKTSNYYNISNSNLNSEFFYAFASKQEAYNYLLSIYTEHINAQEDNSCPNSQTGFYYRYYDGVSKTMKENCFVDSNSGNHKGKALTAVSSSINSMIFETYSANILFGDSSINQIACDSSVSEYCDGSMYKKVYLQKTYDNGGNLTNTAVVESCIASETIECVKVYAKIIRGGSTQGNSSSFVLGATDNGANPDSYSMTIYSSPKGGSTSSITYTNTNNNFLLSKDTYYVFEEKDTTITYRNSLSTNGDVSHYNVTYYAIYVDNNDYLKVYYTDDKVAEPTINLINTDGVGSVKTNHNTFNIIIKNDGDADFVNKYEIYEVKNGDYYVAVYSYLRVTINGVNYNLNDNRYIKYVYDDNNRIIDYYFEIPIVNMNLGLGELIAEIHILDRAGTDTYLRVSHSQTAPNISVTYSGEGGDKIANLQITDNPITTIDTSSIKVYFSENNINYSESAAENILKSLLCIKGTTGYVYGCVNDGPVNSSNVYKVRISNEESLYGFFKVEAADDHGNSNMFYFMHNPADMSAFYTSANVKYIKDEGEIKRTISNEDIKIEWNNELNYLILYKQNNDGEFVEVCNSMNMNNSSNTLCSAGGNASNYVEVVLENEKYSKSIVRFVEEGFYKAEIINRASIVINSSCLTQDGEILENCKNIATEVFDPISKTCPWDSDEAYCSKPYNIIKKSVLKLQNVGNNYVEYDLFEVDKTAPVVDTNYFSVQLANGEVAFTEGATYENAEVTIVWKEKYVRMVYECEYVGVSNTNCIGNPIGGFGPTAQMSHTFYVENKTNTTYRFWFEDIAGNTTTANKMSFTINVVLPSIEIYQVDENNEINENGKIEFDENGAIPRIKNNVRVVCYHPQSNEKMDCDVYNIVLYKVVGGNRTRVEFTSGKVDLSGNIISYLVTENEEGTYIVVASIRFEKQNSEYMTNEGISILTTESPTFTIDKVPPTINVSIGDGGFNTQYQIYKGSVNVQIIDGVLGATGTIYTGCKVGGSIEECTGKPIAINDEDKNLTEVISKTGTYIVVAKDSIGNSTQDKDKVYITIDNENPTISVTAKSKYLDYKMPENGYTNVDSILVETQDNNVDSIIMYCKITETDNCNSNSNWLPVYEGETENKLGTFEFTEEGYYKVKAVDIMGHESYIRSFIIYRQKPIFTLHYVDDGSIISTNEILKKDFYVSWADPENELQAPIVKVTMNGMPYEKEAHVTESGEYTFMFYDLAGNSSTYKVSVNKSDKMCLDNICIAPKAQFIVSVEKPLLKASMNYQFKENDVIIMAAPVNYYGNNADCAYGVYNYKTLEGADSLQLIDAQIAEMINKAGVKLNLTQERIDLINDLGGSVYIFVVDLEVAEEYYGFKLKEDLFFEEDPLGWGLILVASIAVLYVGIKLVFFRKKVRVLK